MLCSIVKHALQEAAWARNKCRRETRDVVECFSLLLEWSSRFLSALQQNEAQSRLLHLFYDKESLYFSTHSTSFSKQTSFSKRTVVASACTCTLFSLIKHAKISQSQSLLEWFKWFDWLNKMKAVKHIKAKHQSSQTLHSSEVTPVVLQSFSV